MGAPENKRYVRISAQHRDGLREPRWSNLNRVPLSKRPGSGNNDVAVASPAMMSVSCSPGETDEPTGIHPEARAQGFHFV